MRGRTRSIRASRNIKKISLTPGLQPGDLDALIESNRLNGLNAFQAVETAFSWDCLAAPR
jgi:hypothetical protein